MDVLVSAPDHGLNTAWRSLIVARNRLNYATSQLEIDAAIYEMKAAELRFKAAYELAKGGLEDGQ